AGAAGRHRQPPGPARRPPRYSPRPRPRGDGCGARGFRGVHPEPSGPRRSHPARFHQSAKPRPAPSRGGREGHHAGTRRMMMRATGKPPALAALAALAALLFLLLALAAPAAADLPTGGRVIKVAPGTPISVPS